MAIIIEFPSGVDQIDYLASFASAFISEENMHSALLGMQDSLRQANLIPTEPLGMLSCLTAEEEAAAFLYYALRNKGYAVPDHGKLYRHRDKVKVLILASTLLQYFFNRLGENLGARILIEREADRPLISLRIPYRSQEIVVDDPLGIVSTIGEGDNGHDAAIEHAVQLALSKVILEGTSVKSRIDYLANRRNKCLYGNPAEKYRLRLPSDVDQFIRNCVCITVVGMLVYNREGRSTSMEKLIRNIIGKLSTS